MGFLCFVITYGNLMKSNTTVKRIGWALKHFKEVTTKLNVHSNQLPMSSQLGLDLFFLCRLHPWLFVNSVPKGKGIVLLQCISSAVPPWNWTMNCSNIICTISIPGCLCLSQGASEWRSNCPSPGAGLVHMWCIANFQHQLTMCFWPANTKSKVSGTVSNGA